jgi:hypothetical protein
MTAPLRLVPPDRQLRDAAIEWAENSAALAQALASGLRSGQHATNVAQSVRPLIRASSALLDAMCQLLDAEAPSP